MIIELRKSVIVRSPSGKFVTLPEGAKVNYSWKREGQSTVHRFVSPSKIGLLEHVTVTALEDNPPWL